MKEWDGSEGEALSEWVEAFEAKPEDVVDDYRSQYNSNKKAKVGELIICPVCEKKFVKKSYQQAFCPRKDHACKDRYWNTVDPKRRSRAKIFSGNTHIPDDEYDD